MIMPIIVCVRLMALETVVVFNLSLFNSILGSSQELDHLSATTAPVGSSGNPGSSNALFCVLLSASRSKDLTPLPSSRGKKKKKKATRKKRRR